MRIFHNTNYNFLRWRWHAVALSWVVILAGVGVMLTKGIPRGIEFAGGTAVIAQFDQAPSVENVRTALNQNFPGGGQNAVAGAVRDFRKNVSEILLAQLGLECGPQDIIRSGGPGYRLSEWVGVRGGG